MIAIGRIQSGRLPMMRFPDSWVSMMIRLTLSSQPPPGGTKLEPQLPLGLGVKFGRSEILKSAFRRHVGAERLSKHDWLASVNNVCNPHSFAVSAVA